MPRKKLSPIAKIREALVQEQAKVAGLTSQVHDLEKTLAAKILNKTFEETNEKHELAKSELGMHYIKVTLKLKTEPTPAIIKNVLRVSETENDYVMEYDIDGKSHVYRELMRRIEWRDFEHG